MLFTLINTIHLQFIILTGGLPVVNRMSILLLIIVLVQTIIISILMITRLKQKKALSQSINKDDQELTEIEYIRKRNQLRALIDAMPDSIYIKDREGRFLLANYTTAQLLGARHPKEILGKTGFDLLDEDLASEYHQDEQHVINTGEPIINKEETGLNLKGERVIKSTTKVPYRDENNNIIGVISIDRDISKQKQNEQLLFQKSEELNEVNQLLEERQEKIEHQSASLQAHADAILKEKNLLLTLINTVPDYIYIKDKQCRFITANEKIIRVMGAGTLDNLIGKSDHDFYTKSLADIFKSDDETVLQTGQPVVNKEESGFDDDGMETIVSTTKYPIRDAKGNIVGLVGIGRDIRKQKEVERTLMEQSKNLQEANTLLEERQEEIQQQSEELKAQSDNLQEINLKLEQLNRTKNKFFSIIAHDLKNPFHAIVGFTDIILDNLDEFDKQKIGELLEMVRGTTSNAYNLLENLLSWARTQTESIKYTPKLQSLTEVLNENISYIKSIAQTKQIQVESQVIVDCNAWFDRDMIDTVIRNLLNNAVKFTQKGGTVSVFCKRLDTIRCQVSVKDTGIGISQENLQKLFKIEQYYSTSGTEGETGTGLGLIICKEFISKNHGTLSVSSEPGKGTTFTFTLPLDTK